jgi:YhcH/YjgK/YiaL family protein
MVVDTLENLEKYVSLNPLFKDVVDFIKSNDLNALEAGKHFIKGDDLFVNITTAKGKTKDEAALEIHRKMIDIQIPLNTSETYGYTPLCDLPEGDFNTEKDICKFPGLQSQTYVTCQANMFAIFFPQDGHAPCISESAEIKKAIFKVKA